MWCKTCKKKKDCVEVCRDLNNWLNRQQSKEGYSERWVRYKERPFSNDWIDIKVAEQLGKRFGRIKKLP